MHLNWANIAASILGVYIFYAPFAYKHSRERGTGRVGALFYTLLMYVLFFLWIAGAGDTLYGLGMVIDKPAEYCGSGCVEPGEGHWESPRAENILAGLGMMAAGWVIGKAVENAYGRD